MKILLTLPGQGSQYPYMLQDLPAHSPITQQAKTFLGDEFYQLDSPEALQHTRAVQLCLLIMGVAWGNALLSQGVKADMVCGFSIGAYPAAVLAGVLSFKQALALVALRGKLMEQSYPKGYGLTAISGLNQQTLETLLINSHCYLANINTEYQLVIAGSHPAMSEVGQRALKKGAIKVTPLKVSVPSHCPLLQDTARQLSQFAQTQHFTSPTLVYLSSTHGRGLRKKEAIIDDLLNNLCKTVHWYQAMIAAEQHDIQLAIELPPGNILTQLNRKIFQQATALSIAVDGMETIMYWANR